MSIFSPTSDIGEREFSRSMALVLSLAVLFGFYALLSFGIILGNRSNAAAPFAPWMADLAGLAAGWLLMRSCPG